MNHLRLADNVKQSLKDLNQHYKDLTGLQASVATESKESELQRQVDEHRFLQLVYCASCRICSSVGRLKKEALKIFIDCTKTDLSLNNWVTRAKILNRIYVIHVLANQSVCTSFAPGASKREAVPILARSGVCRSPSPHPTRGEGPSSRTAELMQVTLSSCCYAACCMSNLSALHSNSCDSCEVPRSEPRAKQCVCALHLKVFGQCFGSSVWLLAAPLAGHDVECADVRLCLRFSSLLLSTKRRLHSTTNLD